MKNLKEIILRNYGGIIVKADIDELNEDVNLAILYEDHGDEFLFIRTDEGCYEYGWYLNRPGYPDYSDLEEERYGNYFIRDPKLFYEEDYRSKLSNEIFARIHSGMYYDGFYEWGGWSPKVERRQDEAQYKFNRFVRFMKDVEERGITYHKDDDRHLIEQYLEANEIATLDNIDKLNSIKWNSRIDGFDGIAGKEEGSDGWIKGDSIIFIIHNGKRVNPRKCKIKSKYDDWDTKTFRLNINQFK